MGAGGHVARRTPALSAKAAQRGERAAQDYLAELARVRPGLDPVSQLKGRGAVVTSVPLASHVAGGVGVRRGRAVVLVNSSHSAARRRFTAAHELGHLVLHPTAFHTTHVDTIVDKRADLSMERRSPEDRAADAFAAGVLMPRVCLLRDVPDGVADLYGVAESVITKLARRYQVTRTMMVCRLMGLGLLGAT